MTTKNLQFLKDFLAGRLPSVESRFNYPPPIAKTLGFSLVAIDHGRAELEMTTDSGTQANPMGTIHGGVLVDLADAAIGTAHATTLEDSESFTSLDLQINFFRPVWNEKIRAVAAPVHSGNTVSRYVCDIRKVDGKLVAQVTSSVITLRAERAEGR